MTIAISCAAILGALVFGLGFNVSRLRGIVGKAGGAQQPTDPTDRLFVAVRAHGNAAEYVPTLMVLFLLVGERSPAAVAIPLIIGATVARLAHVVGMLTTPDWSIPTRSRLVGALGTYLFGVALAIAAAVTLL
ncbi:MAPEG family protein [Pseudofrankia inefficax]|uniref:Membrane-associated protein in eicosanoid and glutathione metabolism (MAPEG) n=1 Tax=Pseudofrankia inefficax (strain DSM 45817 / CECT 9037 / DDB 130130 / EuI1c) TaxID=298654 RepID=E3J7I1_PSEI1|nr:MAPEG family protein [Pseudofrankia inefficax]ADP79590.1 membrane-associated protein in eicosanoid and glutathione metabolism (MAPEG) [Pseudofrankia inefficax]